jgi:hypothetical protein
VPGRTGPLLDGPSHPSGGHQLEGQWRVLWTKLISVRSASRYVASCATGISPVGLEVRSGLVLGGQYRFPLFEVGYGMYVPRSSAGGVLQGSAESSIERHEND